MPCRVLSSAVPPPMSFIVESFARNAPFITWLRVYG